MLSTNIDAIIQNKGNGTNPRLPSLTETNDSPMENNDSPMENGVGGPGAIAALAATRQDSSQEQKLMPRQVDI